MFKSIKRTFSSIQKTRLNNCNTVLEIRTDNINIQNRSDEIFLSFSCGQIGSLSKRTLVNALWFEGKIHFVQPEWFCFNCAELLEE